MDERGVSQLATGITVLPLLCSAFVLLRGLYFSVGDSTTMLAPFAVVGALVVAQIVAIYLVATLPGRRRERRVAAWIFAFVFYGMMASSSASATYCIVRFTSRIRRACI